MPPKEQKSPGSYRRLPQAIDLNLLPVEYRRKPVSNWTVLFFLVSLGAASLLSPLNNWKADQDVQLMRLKTELATKQQAAKQVPALEKRVKDLGDSLSQISKKAASYQQDYQAWSRRAIAWSKVVAAIDKEASNQKIVLRSVTQQGFIVTAKGVAPDYAAAVGLAASLSGSGLFETVSFEQIGLENVVPQPQSPLATPPRLAHVFTLILEVKPGGGR